MAAIHPMTQEQKAKRYSRQGKPEPKSVIAAKEQALAKFGETAHCNNSPIIGDYGINTKPGDNSKYAGMLLEICKWPKVDTFNIEALEERLEQYANYCYSHDIRITNTVCYLSLGITNQMVYEWQHELSGTRAHHEFIQKVKQVCGCAREQMMVDGKLNPVTGIFHQVNYDGLRDVKQQEIVIAQNNVLGAARTVEELGSAYLEGLPDCGVE